MSESQGGPSFCRVVFEECFHYQAPKVVRIKDSRLGCFLVFLNWAIVVPMAWLIITQHWTFQQEESMVSYNSWVDNSDFNTASGTPWYCDNSTTDYQYSSEWTYNDNGCRRLLAYEVFEKHVPTSMNFVSYFSTARYQRTCTGGSGVMPGSCGAPVQVENQSNFFVPDVEQLHVHYSHNLQHTGASTNYTNPKITFKDHNGNEVATFNKGSLVVVKVADLLSWAGVNLDHRNLAADDGAHSLDPSFILCTETNTCPLKRMTGVRLQLNAVYTNMHPEDPFDDTPEAIVTVLDASSDWNSAGGVPHYHYSALHYLTEFTVVDNYLISVNIVTSGNMGQFSVIEVVKSVVIVLVILKLAQLIVDTFARMFIKSFMDVTSDVIEEEQSGGKQSPRMRDPTSSVMPATEGGSDLLTQVSLLKDSFLYAARSDAQRDYEMHELNRKFVELKRTVERMGGAPPAASPPMPAQEQAVPLAAPPAQPPVS